MILTEVKRKLWSKVIEDLEARGAEVMVIAEVIDNTCQYYIEAKWRTGRHWIIKRVESNNEATEN